MILLQSLAHKQKEGSRCLLKVFVCKFKTFAGTGALRQGFGWAVADRTCFARSCFEASLNQEALGSYMHLFAILSFVQVLYKEDLKPLGIRKASAPSTHVSIKE